MGHLRTEAQAKAKEEGKVRVFTCLVFVGE